MRHTSRRQGFTLVELLVVIGIIAVLIAILLPVLSAARNHARTIKCASNERQIFMGFMLYAQDNKGWIPPRGLSYSPYPYWQNFLTSFNPPNNWTIPVNYLASGLIFFCPSQETLGPQSGGTLRGGYGMNNRMFGYATAAMPRWLGVDSTGTFYYNVSKARTPCDLYLIGDTSAVLSGGSFLGQPTLLNQTTQRPDFRHDKGMNMLFQDGHVMFMHGTLNPTYQSEVADSSIYTYAPPWWNNKAY